MILLWLKFTWVHSSRINQVELREEFSHYAATSLKINPCS
jgi:hypothetical protein